MGDDAGSGDKLKEGLQRGCLALLGIGVFVTIGFALEDMTGLPIDTTYRIACAGMCLFLVFKIGSDYPGELWPKVALGLALLVNSALFFTPLLARPASRGELMIFLLPDAVILLAARTFSYRATDAHQRAVHQQLIVGLVVATAVCAALFALMLI